MWNSGKACDVIIALIAGDYGEFAIICDYEIWIDLVRPQGMEAHRRQFRGGGSITCPDYMLFSSSFLLQQKLQQDDVSIGDGVFDCLAQALSAEKQSTPGQSKLSTRL